MRPSEGCGSIKTREEAVSELELAAAHLPGAVEIHRIGTDAVLSKNAMTDLARQRDGTGLLEGAVVYILERGDRRALMPLAGA